MKELEAQGPGADFLLRMLSTLLKIGLASLLTGAVLAEFDVSANDLLAQAGLTPQDIADNRRIAKHYIEVGRAHKFGTDGAPFHDVHSHPLPPR